jgi:hypothetical protein
MLLFPLTPLGDEGWRIAAALTARHIGASLWLLNQWMFAANGAAKARPGALGWLPPSC